MKNIRFLTVRRNVSECRLDIGIHIDQDFFKENVRYPVWTSRDPISVILGTSFSLILGT